MTILNTARKLTAAVVAFGLTGSSVASAQGPATIRPSTENIRPSIAPSYKTPTDNMKYNPAAPSYKTPTDNLRYNPAIVPAPLPTAAPRSTAPVPTTAKPAAVPGPPADAIIGTWTINATKQMFDLKISSVVGNRIWYTTSMDNRLRSGVYNPLTGFIDFTHTDRDGVMREFTGNLRNTGGKLTGQGSSQSATASPTNALVSTQFFKATKSQ